MIRGKLFKPYYQDQLMLLPPNIEELISAGHAVRFVNKVIDVMNIQNIVEEYKGGGAPSYDPGMLIKILAYGYMDGVRSCRKIAKALRENINYMWLSGMQTPDFRTINNFRSGKLKTTIKDVFKQVVEAAVELGLVSFDKLFIDGTKIEADSNKYKMVWRKNVEKYKARMNERIDDLFDEIDRLNEEENRLYGDKDLPEIDENRSEERQKLVDKKIKETAEKINKSLEKKKKKISKEIFILQKRKDNYEEQEQILGARNSYSKTDTDASAMKMKNNEIKPGYNLMIGTENQIIVNYEIEQKASDNACFVNLMENTKRLYSKQIKKGIGDQAFGTEENYAYCEEESIEPYLKFSTFHKEKSRKFRENIFNKENFRYNNIKDMYICPSEKELKFKSEDSRITATGYKSNFKIYVCKDCSNCHYKAACCPHGKARQIQINEKLERYKLMARELLNSDEGIKLRKKRGNEVETVFGDIKHNQKFRRFSLRGKLKVNLEAGLLAIAYNIRKIRSKLTDNLKKKLENAANLIPQNFNFVFCN